MRYPAIIVALIGAVLLTGCSTLISLNPFVAASQTVSDPAIVGTWKTADKDDKGRIVIEQQGSVYVIRFEGMDEPIILQGHLTRVGDAELMDVVNTESHDLAVPVHLVVRLWPSASTLKWVYLESDWLKDQARQALSTQPSNSDTLITTPGDAVPQFLKKFGADARAYSGEPSQLVKGQ